MAQQRSDCNTSTGPRGDPNRWQAGPRWCRNSKSSFRDQESASRIKYHLLSGRSRQHASTLVSPFNSTEWSSRAINWSMHLLSTSWQTKENPENQQDSNIPDNKTASSSSNVSIRWGLYRVLHHANHAWWRTDRRRSCCRTGGRWGSLRISTCVQPQFSPLSWNATQSRARDQLLVSSQSHKEHWHLCPQVGQTQK